MPPPRQRRARLSTPKEAKLSTRLGLFSYAFSKLPPRQLPLLALYAYALVGVTKRGWIAPDFLGKTGASIVGVLSMVTGLLLSYRFSSALSKWEEGKKVWVGVRTDIRDGIRMLSIPPTLASSTPSSTMSAPVDLGDISPIDDDHTQDATDAEADGDADAEESDFPGSNNSSPSKLPTSTGSYRKSSVRKQQDIVTVRMDELSGLLVGFAFALQHHLSGTRPLPQPPLCDLLPPPFLSSLKRTEARVRFAESHLGPSGSSVSLGNLAEANSSTESLRPALRRRGTGPPSKEENRAAGFSSSDDEWELSNLRTRAEEAVARLADAVAGSAEASIGEELKQQLGQLNLPEKEKKATMSAAGVDADGDKANGTPGKPRSNLHSPHPNLPLALLRLMEAYVIGLAEVPTDKGGWAEAKRERMLGVVKSLTGHLGEAERLRANPPPLPLSLHLSHLLLIYLLALPASLLCVVSGYSVVIITIIAGWCFLGLEALVGEVGGVFGNSENHHPLPRYTAQILAESLDVSPGFMKSYRARLVGRVGEDDAEVVELDRRARRGVGECWVPSF